MSSRKKARARLIPGCRVRCFLLFGWSAPWPCGGTDLAPEFLVGQVAVEIGLPGDLLEQGIGLAGQPTGLVGTAQPVDPFRLRGECRRHGF
jgi:hypothetical protein